MTTATGRPLTEAQWQTQVLDLARRFGWHTYHTRYSLGSMAGFPDLVLWHTQLQVTLFVELKSDKGRETPTQRDCLASLGYAGNAVYTWRPADWDQVVARLSRRNGVTDSETPKNPARIADSCL